MRDWDSMKRNAHLAVPMLASEHERSPAIALGVVGISPILEQFPGNLLVMR